MSTLAADSPIAGLRAFDLARGKAAELEDIKRNAKAIVARANLTKAGDVPALSIFVAGPIRANGSLRLEQWTPMQLLDAAARINAELMRRSPASFPLRVAGGPVVNLKRLWPDVCQLTADNYGVELGQVLGRSRHLGVMNARHLARWLILRATGVSQSELGRASGFEHCTILNSVRYVDGQRSISPPYVTRTNNLLEKLNAKLKS